MIAKDKDGNVVAVSPDGQAWTSQDGASWTPHDIATIEMTPEERAIFTASLWSDEAPPGLLLQVSGFLRLVADGLPASREEARELLDKIAKHV